MEKSLNGLVKLPCSKYKGSYLVLVIVMIVIIVKYWMETQKVNMKLYQGWSNDADRVPLQEDEKNRLFAMNQPLHHVTGYNQTKEDDTCEVEQIIFPFRSVVMGRSTPGYKMLLHGPNSDTFISDSLYNGNGYTYFEKDLQRQMEQALPKYDVPHQQVVILDIGANIGLHALYFASKGYEVHAFEPLPTNYHLLQCSKVANNFTNLIINKVGLSDHAHNTCMKVNPKNQGAAQIKTENSNECSDSDQIQLQTLDEYMERNLGDKQPYLVKIDVEGHEVATWLGGQKFLKERPPKYIFSEVIAEEIHKFGGTVVQYFEMMSKFGYRIYHIHERRWIEGPPFSAELEHYSLFDAKMVHSSVQQE